MFRTNRPILSGFTLLEVLCVCAVIGILLAVSAPAIGYQVLQARVRAETDTLQNMAAAARASFESSDLESTNIAALEGAIPAGVDPTAFSTSLDPASAPATTQASDWFAKIARQMGYSPQLGIAPSPSLQPEVAALLFNSYNNTRFMLVGPADEPTQQRFLFISLVAPPGELALPALPNSSNAQDPADLALFDDIWNTNWASSACPLPPSWLAALSPAQVQAWQGGANAPSRTWQLCVQRIVCPKFSITINNTHPADNCYVFYNINGTTAGASSTIAANSGSFVITGLYYGRLIQSYRGTAPPPAAQLFSQFTLRDNCEITLQD
jgi:prepilin-type N-terminal cleavage/methylation domain-containing protein